MTVSCRTDRFVLGRGSLPQILQISKRAELPFPEAALGQGRRCSSLPCTIATWPRWERLSQQGLAVPETCSPAPASCRCRSALRIFQVCVLLWTHLSHRSDGWSLSQGKAGGKMG